MEIDEVINELETVAAQLDDEELESDTCCALLERVGALANQAGDELERQARSGPGSSGQVELL